VQIAMQEPAQSRSDATAPGPREDDVPVGSGPAVETREDALLRAMTSDISARAEHAKECAALRLRLAALRADINTRRGETATQPAPAVEDHEEEAFAEWQPPRYARYLATFYAFLLLAIFAGSALSVGVKMASGCDTHDPEPCNTADRLVQSAIVTPPAFVVYATWHVPAYFAQRALPVILRWAARLAQLPLDLLPIVLRVLRYVIGPVHEFAVFLYELFKLMFYRPIVWCAETLICTCSWAYDSVIAPVAEHLLMPLLGVCRFVAASAWRAYESFKWWNDKTEL
jgi:hypothetical protein